MTNLADLREKLERVNDRLGGVSIERMGGDNLAVTLCTHFEDAEGEQDENGWTEAATDGCDETLQAIRDHYAPLFTEFLDLLDAKEAREGELREALDWYADQMCEGWCDNDPKACSAIGSYNCAGCPARLALSAA